MFVEMSCKMVESEVVANSEIVSRKAMMEQRPMMIDAKNVRAFMEDCERRNTYTLRGGCYGGSCYKLAGPQRERIVCILESA